jgi:hypothetical protein
MQNRMEIFNEVVIQVLTFIYMMFKNSFRKDDRIGKAYIAIYLLCVLVNLLNLFRSVLILQLKA